MGGQLGREGEEREEQVGNHEVTPPQTREAPSCSPFASAGPDAQGGAGSFSWSGTPGTASELKPCGSFSALVGVTTCC